MGSGEEVIEIDSLEKELLTGVECEDDPILYSATFRENEDSFVKYQTAQWVMYSLLLMLAWGIGLFMLLYLPVRRFILRKDIQSRKLYLTPNAIVYKVRCFLLGNVMQMNCRSLLGYWSLTMLLASSHSFSGNCVFIFTFWRLRW